MYSCLKYFRMFTFLLWFTFCRSWLYEFQASNFRVTLYRRHNKERFKDRILVPGTTLYRMQRPLCMTLKGFPPRSLFKHCFVIINWRKRKRTKRSGRCVSLCDCANVWQPNVTRPLLRRKKVGITIPNDKCVMIILWRKLNRLPCWMTSFDEVILTTGASKTRQRNTYPISFKSRIIFVCMCITFFIFLRDISFKRLVLSHNWSFTIFCSGNWYYYRICLRCEGVLD